MVNEEDLEGGALGCDWAATRDTSNEHAATPKTRQRARIEWSEAMPQHSTTVPVASSGSQAGYDAARRHAGLIERPDQGRILVSGRDRATYLHGLLTNDIAALQPGTGCYAAWLTPQGRMIADLRVFELGDVILLSLLRDVKDAVLAKLDQFVFTEDVQLGDVSDTFSSVSVAGPEAARVVAAAIGGTTVEALSTMPEHANKRADFEGQPAIVVRAADTGEPGFELFVPAGQRDALDAALRGAGAVPVDAAAAEVLRIEAGVPKFHLDMDEETIPLEAGIESRAISMTKGCYVGQEVIVRVLHRGHGRVARRLVGLTLDGEAVPPPQAAVEAGGREIGRVTSSASSPAVGRPIALAYVHRDFVAPGTEVSVAGARAAVTSLPFVPRPL
jgi:tRNA-modifying protein YgfZ